jgi:hypothetical protein
MVAEHKAQLALGASVPVIPGVCSYKIEWSAVVAGRDYTYMHFQVLFPLLFEKPLIALPFMTLSVMTPAFLLTDL